MTDATSAASEARYLTDAVLSPLIETARDGAAELRELAPMLARLGPIEGPTRRQKRTWRRRVSRARWSNNTQRDARRGEACIIDWPSERRIVPPWER